jgi:hypothetical protein
MTPEETRSAHERFIEWDAAYVLGALTAADRRAFEDHLEDCEPCRRAVAQLAPTVGLLSRITREDAERLDDGPDGSARSGLVSLARERARRRRRTTWLVAAAAAVLVVAAVAVPVELATLASVPTTSFALQDVADVPLEASVRLTDVDWGTRIELDCRYPDVYATDVPEGGWTYTLAVVAADGSDATVSTWRAEPGTSARLSAGTALTVGDIRAIEIRTAGGAVLMRHELPVTSD